MLQQLHVRTGGKRQVVPLMRGGTRKRCDEHTLGAIEKPREVMGHSTVQLTERYAQLRPDMFGAADLARVAVDLSTPKGKIIPLAAAPTTESGALAHTVVAPTEEGRKTGR